MLDSREDGGKTRIIEAMKKMKERKSWKQKKNRRGVAVLRGQVVIAGSRGVLSFLGYWVNSFLALTPRGINLLLPVAFSRVRASCLFINMIYREKNCVKITQILIKITILSGNPTTR